LSGARVVGSIVTRNTVPCLGFPESETPPEVEAFLSYSLIWSGARCVYILNLSWWPQQNIDLAAQYTGYTRFNEAGTNYDGAGRNAGGNNSIYLLAQFIF
jgi:hypothetical protein